MSKVISTKREFFLKDNLLIVSNTEEQEIYDNKYFLPKGGIVYYIKPLEEIKRMRYTTDKEIVIIDNNILYGC